MHLQKPPKRCAFRLDTATVYTRLCTQPESGWGAPEAEALQVKEQALCYSLMQCVFPSGAASARTER